MSQNVAGAKGDTFRLLDLSVQQSKTKYIFNLQSYDMTIQKQQIQQRSEKLELVFRYPM